MLTVLAQVARGKRSSRECRAGTSPPSATNLCLSNAVHNANVRPSDDYVGNASTSTYGQSRTTTKKHCLTTLAAAVVPIAGKATKQIGTTVNGNLRYEFKQRVVEPLLLSRPLLQRQTIVRSVMCKRCCECRCGSPPSLTTHSNYNMCHLTMCILVFAVENPTTPLPNTTARQHVAQHHAPRASSAFIMKYP